MSIDFHIRLEEVLQSEGGSDELARCPSPRKVALERRGAVADALLDADDPCPWVEHIESLSVYWWQLRNPALFDRFSSGAFSHLTALTLAGGDERRHTVPSDEYFDAVSATLGTLPRLDSLTLEELDWLPERVDMLGRTIGSALTKSVALRVELAGFPGAALAPLLAPLPSGKLRGLALSRVELAPDDLTIVLAKQPGIEALHAELAPFPSDALCGWHPREPRLREFGLRHVDADRDLPELLLGGGFDALRRICFRAVSHDDALVSALARIVSRAATEEVAVTESWLSSTDGIVAMLAAGSEHLRRVDLHDNNLLALAEETDAMVDAIGPGLRELDVSRNYLGDEFAFSLASSPKAAQLERLRVVDNMEMTQAGLDALLASDHLRPAVKAQLEAEGLESED